MYVCSHVATYVSMHTKMSIDVGRFSNPLIFVVYNTIVFEIICKLSKQNELHKDMCKYIRTYLHYMLFLL